MFKIIRLTFCFLFFISASQAQHISLLQQGKPTSIRGLSVVNDKVAWISGSKGYIAITTDGGKTWAWQQVKGFEQADFRDIEAFSAKEAIIMSSGTPALILKTTDGGVNWQVKYRNTDTAYFLDAMDFAGKKHGFILGDPINNKFLLLETKDGGETWREYNNRPAALPGEAAFAASGTCLRVDGNLIQFVSGGTVARYFTNVSPDTAWIVDYLPIIQGKASQGAFSLAFGRVFVGGDYTKDTFKKGVACWFDPALVGTKNGYESVLKSPVGFQSCVENIGGNAYLATGTPGSSISTDIGKTWTKIDGTSFNVCRKAKHGSLVLLAGNGGKIAMLNP